MQEQNINNRNYVEKYYENKKENIQNNSDSLIHALLWCGGFFAYYMIIVLLVTVIIFSLIGITMGLNGIATEQIFTYLDNDFDGIINVIIAISALLLLFSYVSYVLLYKQYMKGEKIYKKPEADSLAKSTCLTFLVSFFVRFVGICGVYILISLMKKYMTVEDINNINNIVSTERMSLTVSTISSVLCAPIYEEIVFRYGAQKNLDKIYPKASVILTSFIFAAMHLNISSFVPIMILSVYMGHLYKKTDNLLYPTLIHMAFNITGVLAQYTISVLF